MFLFPFLFFPFFFIFSLLLCSRCTAADRQHAGDVCSSASVSSSFSCSFLLLFFSSSLVFLISLCGAAEQRPCCFLCSFSFFCFFFNYFSLLLVLQPAKRFGCLLFFFNINHFFLCSLCAEADTTIPGFCFLVFFFLFLSFFPFLVRPGVGSQRVCMCVCVCMSVYPCVCMLVSTCHCVRVCIREREREREYL